MVNRECTVEGGKEGVDFVADEVGGSVCRSHIQSVGVCLNSFSNDLIPSTDLIYKPFLVGLSPRRTRLGCRNCD